MARVKDAWLGVLGHVEAQARADVRYRTPLDLWRAAKASAPDLFPSGFEPDMRVPEDAALLRDLTEAHVAGLPPVVLGDRVWLPAGPALHGGGTVTALPDDGRQVRYHHGPMPEGRHSSACARCREVSRLAVEVR